MNELNHKIYENPSLSKIIYPLRMGISQKKTIILVGKCNVDYDGRASSQLESGERIILLKSDGSVLIHRPRDYPPVNWQPPGSIFRTLLTQNKLYLRVYRRKENEVLEIYFENLKLLAIYDLIDNGEFYLYASEKDMQSAILLKPEILEKGFRPISHEHKVKPGFLDILGVDKEGTLVLVEIKRKRASIDAVKQLKRYYDELCLDEKRKVRAILVAPEIASGVMELLAIYGFEYKQLSPKVCSDIILSDKRQKITDYL